MSEGATQFPAIKIESFEGPYDLLLELAREHKVDLTQISLRTITDDFLAYIKSNPIPPLLQADFLVVAATLLLLKLRQALPDLTDEEEEEINELTDRVRLYLLYREQAKQIQGQWGKQPLLPGPEKLAVDHVIPYPSLEPADITRSIEAVIAKIKLPPDKRRHLRPRGRSLAQCIHLITERLTRLREVQFTDIVANETRETAAVTFLATLELFREQHIELDQSDLFQPIIIRRLL